MQKNNPQNSAAKIKLAYFGVKYFPSKGGVSRTTENLIKNLKDEFDITIYCYKHEKAAENVPGVNVIQFSDYFDESFEIFVKQVSKKIPIIKQRTKEFLNWRYKDHPTRQYKTFVSGYCFPVMFPL